jgi:hypothetical protein
MKVENIDKTVDRLGNRLAVMRVRMCSRPSYCMKTKVERRRVADISVLGGGRKPLKIDGREKEEG